MPRPGKARLEPGLSFLGKCLLLWGKLIKLRLVYNYWGMKVKIDYSDEKIEVKPALPVLPLRDIVIFPHMIYPLLVGRQFTVSALQEAMILDKHIFLCA